MNINEKGTFDNFTTTLKHLDSLLTLSDNIQKLSPSEPELKNQLSSLLTQLPIPPEPSATSQNLLSFGKDSFLTTASTSTATDGVRSTKHELYKSHDSGIAINNTFLSQAACTNNSSNNQENATNPSQGINISGTQSPDNQSTPTDVTSTLFSHNADYVQLISSLTATFRNQQDKTMFLEFLNNISSNFTSALRYISSLWLNDGNIYTSLQNDTPYETDLTPPIKILEEARDIQNQLYLFEDSEISYHQEINDNADFVSKIRESNKVLNLNCFQLQTRLSSVEFEMSSYRDKNEKLMNERDIVLDKLSHTKQEIITKISDYSQLMERFAELQNENNDNYRSLCKARQHLNLLETELNKMITLVDKLYEELAGCKSREAESNNQNIKLKSRLKIVTNELTELTDSISKIKHFAKEISDPNTHTSLDTQDVRDTSLLSTDHIIASIDKLSEFIEKILKGESAENISRMQSDLSVFLAEFSTLRSDLVTLVDEVNKYKDRILTTDQKQNYPDSLSKNLANVSPSEEISQAEVFNIENPLSIGAAYNNAKLLNKIFNIIPGIHDDAQFLLEFLSTSKTSDKEKNTQLSKQPNDNLLLIKINDIINSHSNGCPNNSYSDDMADKLSSLLKLKDKKIIFLQKDLHKQNDGINEHTNLNKLVGNFKKKQGDESRNLKKEQLKVLLKESIILIDSMSKALKKKFTNKNNQNSPFTKRPHPDSLLMENLKKENVLLKSELSVIAEHLSQLLLNLESINLEQNTSQEIFAILGNKSTQTDINQISNVIIDIISSLMGKLEVTSQLHDDEKDILQTNIGDLLKNTQIVDKKNEQLKAILDANMTEIEFTFVELKKTTDAKIFAENECSQLSHKVNYLTEEIKRIKVQNTSRENLLTNKIKILQESVNRYDQETFGELEKLSNKMKKESFNREEQESKIQELENILNEKETILSNLNNELETYKTNLSKEETVSQKNFEGNVTKDDLSHLKRVRFADFAEFETSFENTEGLMSALHVLLSQERLQSRVSLSLQTERDSLANENKQLRDKLHSTFIDPSNYASGTSNSYLQFKLEENLINGNPITEKLGYSAKNNTIENNLVKLRDQNSKLNKYKLAYRDNKKKLHSLIYQKKYLKSQLSIHEFSLKAALVILQGMGIDTQSYQLDFYWKRHIRFRVIAWVVIFITKLVNSRKNKVKEKTSLYIINK